MSEANKENQNQSPVITKSKRKWAFLALCSVPLTALTAWAVNTTTGYFSQWVDVGGNVNSSAPTLAVGWGNFMGSSASFAVGSGNSINGSATYSSALGQGLTVDFDSSVVIGSHNQPKVSQVISNGPTVLVLSSGNGISGHADEKKNVMEVYKDGSVIINEPQGDISMGIFQ